MVLFSIPDIRLFWSADPRFLSQFTAGEITTFKPYSRYPPCYKDFSFWIPSTGKAFHENDFCEAVRGIAGDLVEGVELVRALRTEGGRSQLISRVPDRQLCAPQDGGAQRVLPS